MNQKKNSFLFRTDSPDDDKNTEVDKNNLEFFFLNQQKFLDSKFIVQKKFKNFTIFWKIFYLT